MFLFLIDKSYCCFEFLAVDMIICTCNQQGNPCRANKSTSFSSEVRFSNNSFITTQFKYEQIFKKSYTNAMNMNFLYILAVENY